MGLSYSRTTLAVAVCGAALLAASVRGVAQQPAPAAPQGQPGAGRAGGGGGDAAGSLRPCSRRPTATRTARSAARS